MKGMQINKLNSEIAQRQQSDLGRGWQVNMHHASRKPSVI